MRALGRRKAAISAQSPNTDPIRLQAIAERPRRAANEVVTGARQAFTASAVTNKFAALP